MVKNGFKKFKSVDTNLTLWLVSVYKIRDLPCPIEEYKNILQVFELIFSIEYSSVIVWLSNIQIELSRISRIMLSAVLGQYLPA